MPDIQHHRTATLTVFGTPAELTLIPAETLKPVRTLVWDRVVRSFHWSLVAAITIAATSAHFGGATWIDIHVWAGTAAAALVAGRIVWGCLGSTHARFSDFLASPAAAFAHVSALVAGRTTRHRGHNPIGGVMIITLMIFVVVIAITGAVAFGGVMKAGPFAFVTTFATGWRAREIHQALTVVLLSLIALHIAGAVFESRRTRENLFRAMVDGRKEVRRDDHRSSPRQARPLAAAVVAVTLLAAMATIGLALSLRPGLGVPVGKLNPVYASECGACHIPYHPSLLPKAAWQALIAGLDNHFGENASLDAATAARVRDYLVSNAAETADTLAAFRLRRVDAGKTFSITATPYWKRRHTKISDAIFASKAVGGRGNCEACHSDARSGRFYPGNIDIPDEVKP